jgi:hypothetical protein
MPELSRAVAQTLATIVRQPAPAGPPPEAPDLAKALTEGTIQQQAGLLRRLYAAPDMAEWIARYEQQVLSPLASALGLGFDPFRAEIRSAHPALRNGLPAMSPPPPEVVEDEIATEERTEPGVIPLGRFQAADFLLVGDTTLLDPDDGKMRPDGSIGNALVKVHPGTWIGTAKMDGDRVSALQVVYEPALADIESQPPTEVARLYVAGRAVGVLDAAVRDDKSVRLALGTRKTRTAAWSWGCATETGPGTFPVFVRKHKGRVGWMLVLFDSDDDHTQPD